MRACGFLLSCLGIAAIMAIQHFFPPFSTPKSATYELDILTMLGMVGTSFGLAMLMVGRELFVRESEDRLPAAVRRS